jgi:holin-like protein
MQENNPGADPKKRPASHFGKTPKLMLQIGIVFGVCFLGQAVSALLPVAIPGSILSLILLFLLLVLKIVKVDHIRQKADFLLENMAFFFIPAGVGILADIDAIKDHVLPLLAVIAITSLLTFGATALTVRAVVSAQRGFRLLRVKRARARRSRLNSSSRLSGTGASRG